MHSPVENTAPKLALAISALNALPDALFLLSCGGAEGAVVSYANAAALEQFRGDSPGRPLSSVLRHPAVLDAVERTAREGNPLDVSFESIGVQPRSWRGLIRPLAPDMLVLVLQDQTDARRTERMRADFLANASHELRTPLASLAGFVETLRTSAKEDPEARDRFLAIMADQAGRMTRLVNDLLSLSRIELNEHVPPSGETDLVRVTRDVAAGLRPLADARGVGLTIDAPLERLPLTGDADQLAQVVQNLLDNALKYSPAGGTVHMRLEQACSPEGARGVSKTDAVVLSLLSPDGRDGAYAVLRVADEGPGIARQHLPRLSERFYRVEGQRSGGTGLGLAIVKHIVNRHRGGLQVESAVGRGTTFSVYLPGAP